MTKERMGKLIKKLDLCERASRAKDRKATVYYFKRETVEKNSRQLSKAA